VGIEVWANTLAELNALRGATTEGPNPLTGGGNDVRLTGGGSLTPEEARARVFSDLDSTTRLLQENPSLRGEFDHRVRELRERWEQASDLLSDAEMRPIVAEEFQEILEQNQRLQEEIQQRGGPQRSQQQPAYIQEARVPQDSETVLAQGGFQRTNLRYDGRTVYRDGDGLYYHVDNLHKGEAAEIEYYNARGKHLGTLTPEGEPKGDAINGRVLPGL
jgi:hypothetical protein